MKVKKPRWTPIQLYKNYQRWEKLTDEIGSHLDDCLCNKCMECFSLSKFMEKFSEDEHAGAVIEYRKSLEVN